MQITEKIEAYEIARLAGNISGLLLGSKRSKSPLMSDHQAVTILKRTYDELCHMINRSEWITDLENKLNDITT
jgi:hypothetical protein